MNTQGGNRAEESSDEDSAVEYGEPVPVGYDGSMTDLDYINNNVIDVLKPEIEPIPVPKQAGRVLASSSKDQESSEDEDEDEEHVVLDREKEWATLDKMMTGDQNEDSSDDIDEGDGDELDGDVDSGDDGEETSANPPRTKNEIALEEPIQVLVDNEEDMEFLGLLNQKASSDQPTLGEKLQPSLILVGEVLYALPGTFTVVVEGSGEDVNRDSQILNEGSILFREDGLVLGRIHEVFGPVTQPFYLVRLDIVARLKAGDNSTVSETDDGNLGSGLKKKVKQKNKNSEGGGPRVTEEAAKGYLAKMEAFPKGTRICCLPNHDSTAFVSSAMLKQIKQDSGKGCDASNVYDEEVPPEERDFSDDETEAAAKSKNRKKKSGAGNGTGQRSAGIKGNYSNRQQSLQRQIPTHVQQTATTVRYHQPPPPPPPPPPPSQHTPGLLQPHQAGAHMHMQLSDAHPAPQGYPYYPNYHQQQQYAYPQGAGPPPYQQPLQSSWGPPNYLQPWPGFQPRDPPTPLQALGGNPSIPAPNLTMSFRPGPPAARPQYQAKPLAFPAAPPEK